MKPHEKILQMLETVSEDDEKTLDEIDLRFSLWLYGREFGGWNTKDKPIAHSWALDIFGNRIPNSCVNHSSFPRYTRSIDAQNTVKLIESYNLRVVVRRNGECSSYTYGDGLDNLAPWLPTEAISRLHTLVQIIADERGDL